MAEGLKIRIGADLGDAVSQVQRLTDGVMGLAKATAIPISLQPGGFQSQVTALTSAVQKFKSEIAAIPSTSGIGVITDDIKTIAPAAAVAGKAIAAIPREFQPGGMQNSIARLLADVRLLKTEISNFPKAIPPIKPPVISPIPDPFPAVRVGAKGAGQALIDVGRIAQDAPFGFIGIQNNIQPLFDSFQRLKAETGSTGGAFKALAGSLGGVGGVGLALSLVTAAVTFASVGFDAWTRVLGKGKSKADETAESAKKLAEAQRESVESYSKQVIEVESLVRIAKSDVSSKTEQTNALKKLNELIPDNIGKLDALNIKTSAGEQIVRNYTQALIDQAKAQLFINQAAGIEGDKFELGNKFKEKELSLVKDRIAAQKQLASLPANSIIAVEERGTVIDKIERINKEILKVRDQYIVDTNSYNDKLRGLKTEIDKNVAGGLPVDLGKGKTKTEDPLKDAIKNLETYQKEVGLTSEQFQRLIGLRVQLVQRDQVKLGLDDGQLAKEIVTIRNSNELLDDRRKRLDDLAKTASLLTSEKIEALNIDVKIALNDLATGKINKDQLQRKVEGLFKDSGLNIPLPVALDNDTESRLKAQIGSLPVISIPVKMKLADLGVQAQRNLSTFATPLDVFIPDGAVDDARKKIDVVKALATFKPTPIVVGVDTSAARKNTQKLADDINRTLNSAIVDSFAGLGEAIGTALAGGNVQDILGSFIGILASGLKEIGKAIIAYGISISAIKTAIKNPYLAIAAGIGLVAAGAALQTALSKRKFADGGIISSPQNITVGEQGPEVVFPLTNLNSTLRKLGGMQSSEGGFVAATSISGDSLNIIINRAKKRSGNSFN